MNDFAWPGCRVFVTGHTGFKGAWLTLWLHRLGAVVTGFSLPPPTVPSLYDEAKVGELVETNILGDARDPQAVEDAVRASRPDVVFHLAAQPIVRRSFREPRVTWETNVLGTVNVLEAVRAAGGVSVCQIITSDKCYANSSIAGAMRESDPLGGADPYSASKGAAELAVAAWRQSFFPPGRVVSHKLSLVSVRAGNVIGGGDWAEDRLIPDCVRALSDGLPISVRNPDAVRPWQHVLDPLAGYLRLAERQLTDPSAVSDAYNFGPLPTDHRTVGQIVDTVARVWGGGRWAHHAPLHTVPEAKSLHLDITKAVTQLKWEPVYTVDEAVRETISWYRRRHDSGSHFDARDMCLNQIEKFERMRDKRANAVG